MVLCGVPFDFVHPGANQGRSVIVLRDKQAVNLPVRREGRRLFLLGMVAEHAPFDVEVGARLTLHYADGRSEAMDLSSLEHYETWHHWGFARKVRLARAFKVSRQWDGRTTLANLLEVPLRPGVLESVQLADAGKGHRLSVLAVSMEAMGTPPASAAAVRCDLRHLDKGDAGWIAGKPVVSGGVARLTSSATYRVKAPDGPHRVDLEVSGSGSGMVQVLINGIPACTPFTHARQYLPGKRPAFERISVWGRSDGGRVDVTLGPAPAKGLWRHAALHKQGISVRNLVVTPEPTPAHTPPPARAVRFGWVTAPEDPFKQGTVLYSWRGAGAKATQDMICGKEPATLKVDLPPGQYRVRVISARLEATSLRIGTVVPGPARVILQDGKTGILAKPLGKAPSDVELATVVGDAGLSLSIQRHKGAGLWGIAAIDIAPQ